MRKFKSGDRVKYSNWFAGTVQYYEHPRGEALFLKRDDGRGGIAWVGTQHEGLWWATEGELEPLKIIKLENK